MGDNKQEFITLLDSEVINKSGDIEYTIEKLRDIHLSNTGEYKGDREILTDFIECFKKYQKIMKEIDYNKRNSKIPFSERVVYQKLADILEA